MNTEAVTPEEDEAFAQIERLTRAAMYAICEESVQTVPKAKYDRLLFLMRRSIHAPEHAHEISELLLEE